MQTLILSFTIADQAVVLFTRAIDELGIIGA